MYLNVLQSIEAKRKWQASLFTLKGAHSQWMTWYGRYVIDVTKSAGTNDAPLSYEHCSL